MGQLLAVIGFIVCATIGAALALRKAAKVLDQALQDGGAYDTLSREEVLDVLEQLGENLNDEDAITVVVTDGIAYWVDDDGLMYAPVDENEDIDYREAKRYDAFGAPKSELPKVMFILDKIKDD